MADFRSPVMFFTTVLLVFVLFFGVKSDTCNEDIEGTLRKLLTPEEYPSIQLQALRKDMLRKFQEALEKVDEEDEQNKRSLSSLAAWNNLPNKRNLEALARAGYIRTLPEEEEEENNDSNYKRSLATLAKNGQLPMRLDEEKRGIESLARNGELQRRKEIREMLEQLYDKRDIADSVRRYHLPYGKRFLGSLARSGDLTYQYKRNVQALARNGEKFGNKRNVAAMLRQDNYLNSVGQSTDLPDTDMEKRNLASIKAQYNPKFKRSAAGKDVGSTRGKRQVDYYEDDNAEFSSPVYQNQNSYDYEELVKELAGVYPKTEKRFLGSVAKTGWFRPSSSRLSSYNSPTKRHIGSLARLGWLPSFRTVRRFNRSGRSATKDYSCREIAADGEAENYSVPQEALPLDDKRFLLQPAVDNILLRKIYIHPKSH